MCVSSAQNVHLVHLLLVAAQRRAGAAQLDQARAEGSRLRRELADTEGALAEERAAKVRLQPAQLSDMRSECVRQASRKVADAELQLPHASASLRQHACFFAQHAALSHGQLTYAALHVQSYAWPSSCRKNSLAAMCRSVRRTRRGSSQRVWRRWRL